MSHHHKRDIYYIMPTSRKAARAARIQRWVLTLVVGIGVALFIGVLMYLKDQ